MRVANGPAYGAYCHKFFLRDQPHLAAQMFCKNARAMFAMASDATKKKTEAVALLPTDFVAPILTRASLDQMTTSLLQKGSISYVNGIPKSGISASFAHMSYAMRLQIEKEKWNGFLVDRDLELRRQLCAPTLHKQNPQDRMLHVRRLMEVSMQQQQQFQQQKELHHPLMHRQHHGDGRVPNIKRASAA
jgi:hypothetical protein